jgi:hypothetical protein
MWLVFVGGGITILGVLIQAFTIAGAPSASPLPSSS